MPWYKPIAIIIVSFNSTGCTASYSLGINDISNCNYMIALSCDCFLVYVMLDLWFNSYMKAVCEVPHSTVPPSRSTVVQSKTPQQVLESLFKISEPRTYEPSSMDWKKVVKKLQSFNHPIAANNQERPKNGMCCFNHYACQSYKDC